MKNTIKLLQKFRGVYKKCSRNFDDSWIIKSGFNFTNQHASDVIKEGLLNNKPIMISRFGFNEIGIVSAFVNMQKGSIKYIEYIKGDIDTFWWDEKLFSYAFNCSGLFPLKPEIAKQFSELMLQDMKQVDILGSWLKKEETFKNNLKNTVKIPLRDMDPYYHANPWSEALAGKQILVIHPFAETIQTQYKQRALLFKDKRVLPLFELQTIKAIQSIAGTNSKFENWFQALDYMKAEITKKDFDIALIGCGAYGFPLAAFIKRMGKKAVHIGGSLQAMFGIIGKRWVENETAEFINQSWVKPSKNETPANASFVESGCYW